MTSRTLLVGLLLAAALGLAGCQNAQYLVSLENKIATMRNDQVFDLLIPARAADDDATVARFLAKLPATADAWTPAQEDVPLAVTVEGDWLKVRFSTPGMSTSVWTVWIEVRAKRAGDAIRIKGTTRVPFWQGDGSDPRYDAENFEYERERFERSLRRCIDSMHMPPSA